MTFLYAYHSGKCCIAVILFTHICFTWAIFRTAALVTIVETSAAAIMLFKWAAVAKAASAAFAAAFSAALQLFMASLTSLDKFADIISNQTIVIC